MKNTVLISILLAAAQGFAVAAESSGKQEAPIGATATLSDGSVIKGTLQSGALPAESDLLGDITLDLLKVVSIDAASPLGEAPIQRRVTFRNGDRLTVRFPEDLKEIPFNTVFERVKLPLASVSKLAISGDTSGSLLYHCTFDNEQAITAPAVGPAGTFLNGEFVAGKIGNALRVKADTPAFEAMLPKGFLGAEGCLEFWGRIEGDDSRYVDGGDPLFFSLYDERGAITLLQFAVNNGFARGGLGGAFVSWPFGTAPHYSSSMEYRKVLGENWTSWHHYAISWKAGGFGDGSFAKVFVDGRPLTILGGVDDDKLPARLADYVNHAHELGIPWPAARANDHRRSKKPFLIDELKIWSVPQLSFQTN